MAQEEQEIKKPKRWYEPKCPSVSPIFEWEVDDGGHHLLKKVGEKNFDDEIQLYKDACDIKILVDRINKQPELIDVLKNQANAMPYGDVNNFPSEYHPNAGADALRILYENQPDSVKEKYPTYEKFEKYFVNLTGEMFEKMFAPKEEVKEEKVNE